MWTYVSEFELTWLCTNINWMVEYQLNPHTCTCQYIHWQFIYLFLPVCSESSVEMLSESKRCVAGSTAYRWQSEGSICRLFLFSCAHWIYFAYVGRNRIQFRYSWPGSAIWLQTCLSHYFIKIELWFIVIIHRYHSSLLLLFIHSLYVAYETNPYVIFMLQHHGIFKDIISHTELLIHPSLHGSVEDAWLYFEGRRKGWEGWWVDK